VRIVLACPYAWDAAGGVQVHVRRVAQHLQARGHEATVLSPAFGPVSEEGVVVVGRPARIRYQGTVAPICFSARSARRIGLALTEARPDVVHAHEPLTPSTAMLATLRSKVPVVATFHAFAERSTLLSAAAPVLRPVWGRLQIRVAVSDAAAGFVRSRFGDGLRVIPNGCDVDAFAGAAPAPGLPPGRRLLWVGRLDPQKGFGVAVRAFERVAAAVPDARLVVVGEGRDIGAVELLAPEVRSRVDLVGTVPHDDLPGYHAAAEVFLSPALGQESFGMVLVEAMAAGLPVVATDIPGYREVVRDEREGLLVPPGDAEALAAALEGVLADGTLASRLAEAGRARAERYRWERVVGELEQVYAATRPAGAC
jgi:phosphatidylinositol alpha-mannosyltransferase